MSINIVPTNVWFHDINDNNWDLKSYKHFMNIQSSDDFWKFHNAINIKKGMYFFMNDGVKPLWEDPKNINGVYYSLKVDEKVILDDFLEVSMGYITNSLLLNNNDSITGISITKKNKFFIIKIWLLKDINFQINKEFKLSNYEFICKNNQQNLSKRITKM